MKKILLLSLILMALAVPAATAELVAEPAIPTTVLPGSFFTLVIKITNTDTIAQNDIEVTLDLPKSFDVDEETISIASLAAGQSAALQWSIKVNSDVSSGYEVITADIDSDNSKNQEIDIPVLVKAAESTLEIQQVKTDPTVLQPGSSGIITLGIQNHASYSLRDIHAALTLNPSLPIAPYEETEERLINQLRAKETSTLEFQVTILPDAKPGFYTLPLKLSYLDEFGQNYSRTNTITVEINALPQLEITTEGNALQGKPSELTVKIVNKGLTPIQFLTLHFQSPAVVSSPSVYIGDLDKDDFQTEPITVLASGPVQLPATVEFRDALNKAYSEKITLPVSVIDAAAAKQLGLEKTSVWFYPAMVIVIVLIGYTIWKRIKGLKSENHDS